VIHEGTIPEESEHERTDEESQQQKNKFTDNVGLILRLDNFSEHDL